jgi:hypothetical protein
MANLRMQLHLDDASEQRGTHLTYIEPTALKGPPE